MLFLYLSLSRHTRLNPILHKEERVKLHIPARYILQVLTLAQLLKLSFTYSLKNVGVYSIFSGIIITLSIIIGNNFCHQGHVEMQKKY